MGFRLCETLVSVFRRRKHRCHVYLRNRSVHNLRHSRNYLLLTIEPPGARFYNGEISAYEDLHGQLPSPGTQAWDEAIHRWNADGVLEDNSLQGIRDALHQQEP